MRILLIDYSSAFNTIDPTKLITKLRTLGLNTSLCNCILDILMGHPQVVRVGNNTSAMLTLNTGAHQGWVLSPLLYSLFTHDCMARHDTKTTVSPTTMRQPIGRRSGTWQCGVRAGGAAEEMAAFLRSPNQLCHYVVFFSRYL